MKNLLFLGLIFYVMPTETYAQQPMSAKLIGQISGDILQYDCRRVPNNEERISCDFVQVLLTPQGNSESLERDLLQIPEIMNNAADMRKVMCDVADIGASMLAGTDAPNSLGLTEEEHRKNVERLNSSSPKQRSDLDSFTKVARAVCREINIESVEALIRAQNDQQSRTCKSTINTYSTEYIKLSESLWVADSRPLGGCGVVNTSRFIRDSNEPSFWEHESSKIVLNKDGDSYGISCSILDEEKTLYTWKGGAFFIGCDYID